MGKILIFINSDWFFLLHRVPIAQSLSDYGYEIVVLTKDTGRRKEIENLGFQFVNINIDRKGTNIFREIKTLIEVYKVYKKINPDLVYQVTVKPIIYGSLVSKVLTNKNINTICGLGYVFSNPKKKILRKIVSLFYKLSLSGAKSHTFFENEDDRNVFIENGIISTIADTTVVNGVGVHLEKFHPNKINKSVKKLTVTLATRMLWNKGVLEFVEAAKLLQKKYFDSVEFKLYGITDTGNRESIPNTYLKSITIGNYLKWYGFESDMVNVYSNSDIVTLPSFYGEGLPTVLAEACAMGLPIVTTDSVGCRECVDEGINGFKVPIKSVKALAEAIEKLIISSELRVRMGKASRLKAEREFDQRKIIGQYEEVYERMLNE